MQNQPYNTDHWQLLLEEHPELAEDLEFQGEEELPALFRLVGAFSVLQVRLLKLFTGEAAEEENTAIPGQAKT
jgi:hypothetical protein